MDEAARQLSALIDLLMDSHAIATKVGDPQIISLIEQAAEQAKQESKRRLNKELKTQWLP